MQERAATLDGHTHALSSALLVMATQNPIEQEGTYPLPEAQLDRFLLEVLVGYPSRDEEREVVRRHVRHPRRREARLPSCHAPPRHPRRRRGDRGHQRRRRAGAGVGVGFGDTPGWGRSLAALWILALVVLPLANRHRARLGDLIAGTVVVVEPKAVPMEDLSHEERGPVSAPRFAFTTAQLDIYGIEELHVPEGILRKDASAELMEDVARRICRKIRHKRPPAEAEAGAFLRAFYAAQRARLEQRALFGKRQQRKVR